MEEKQNKINLPPFSGVPWLVYTHGVEKSQQFQTFCMVSQGRDNKSSCIKSIPQLRGKEIHASCHGWVLLLDNDDDTAFTLWNPVTLETIFLPPLEAPEWTDDNVVPNSCVLTSSPYDTKDNCCFVVLFCEHFVFSCRVSLKRDTSSKWSVQRSQLEGEMFEVRKAIACDGVIYCFGYLPNSTLKKRQMIVVEVGDDEDSSTITTRPLGLSLPHDDFVCTVLKSHLIESCGMVYLVSIFTNQLTVFKKIDAVKVWELNVETKNWTEVNSLGDRAFFVDDCNGSTWCMASTGAKSESRGDGFEGNGVYFLADYRTLLYFYKLEDHSLTLFSPCKNLKPNRQAFWIMPHYQRLYAGQDQGTNRNKQHILNAEVRFVDSPMQHKTQDMFSLLPVDMISSISEGLHLFDYLNLRATCKSLRSVLPPSQWRYKDSHPLFLFSKDSGKSCKVMDPSRNDSYFIGIPQFSFTQAFVDFSKNGWLLFNIVIFCEDASLEYLNPFTRVTGKYPPFKHNFTSVGFSTSPTSRDCVTVGIVDIFKAFLLLVYIRNGDETWEVKKIERSGDEFFVDTRPPVYHNGAFYFLDKSGNLGEFKLVEGQSTWKVYVRPQTHHISFVHSHHLVECDGKLLSVFIGDMGGWVEVFRFNKSNSRWVQVKSLGNHNLFIGPSSSLSRTAREHGMGNKVYLPRLCCDRIVYYSLESGKYHAIGSEDSLEDLHGTKEYLKCCWV